MTKAEAIEKVLDDYYGVATLEIIYNEIEKYYPNAKKSYEWQAGIRGVLYRDVGKRFKKMDLGVYALMDYDENQLLVPTENNIDTDISLLVKIRTQQNNYRKSLLKHLRKCPFTGVSDSRLLVASHIKPWCVSNNQERLDINNGFILSPLYDKLFDRGLITFLPDKRVLISSTLSESTRKHLNLMPVVNPLIPTEGREKYLKFHNEKIFIK